MSLTVNNNEWFSNLIYLSSRWLKKADNTHSIQSRTKFVINCFLKYVDSLPESSFDSIGLTNEFVSNTITSIRDRLIELLDKYFDGNIIDAIYIAADLLKKVPITKITDRYTFFRARGNKTGFLYNTEEMFHIPYELRHKIKNQRYSVSGLPCLYLGSSTYICWEEIERPDFQTCNYCALYSRYAINVYDLRIPKSIESTDDIYRVCLALASSLKSNSEHDFKLEYVIPQCLLQSIITDPTTAHDGVGICYYSVHFLYEDTSLFFIDYNNETIVSRFYNVAIPAQHPQAKGVSPLLRNQFYQTTSTSMMHQYLLNLNSNSKLGEINTIDFYPWSQFGILEEHLTYLMEKITKYC